MFKFAQIFLVVIIHSVANVIIANDDLENSKGVSAYKTLKNISDYYDNKNSKKLSQIRSFYQLAYGYYKNHPKELFELFAKTPHVIENFVNHGYRGNGSWIETRETENIFADIIMKIIEQHPKWTEDYKKYYLMKQIHTKCIGIDGFIKLLALKNKYTGNNVQYYFKRANDKDLPYYVMQEDSLKKHFDLYQELTALTDKDINNFTYRTFSFSYEKRLKDLSDQNVHPKGKDKKPNYNQVIEDFANDLLLIESSRQEEKKKKENLAFNANKFKMILPMIHARAGALDFKNYGFINSICRLSVSPYSIIYISSPPVTPQWRHCYKMPYFGILNLQTLIFDKKGTLKYIISFPYGQEPDGMKHPNNKIEAQKNCNFFISKPIYKNGHINDFLTTHIYAPPRIKECLQKDIYKAFDIKFTNIRKDKRLTSYWAYFKDEIDLSDLGLFGGDQFSIPIYYFPPYKSR